MSALWLMFYSERKWHQRTLYRSPIMWFVCMYPFRGPRQSFLKLTLQNSLNSISIYCTLGPKERNWIVCISLTAASARVHPVQTASATLSGVTVSVCVNPGQQKLPGHQWNCQIIQGWGDPWRNLTLPHTAPHPHFVGVQWKATVTPSCTSSIDPFTTNIHRNVYYQAFSFTTPSPPTPTKKP